jgi:hypothetical protein
VPRFRAQFEPGGDIDSRKRRVIAASRPTRSAYGVSLAVFRIGGRRPPVHQTAELALSPALRAGSNHQRPAMQVPADPDSRSERQSTDICFDQSWRNHTGRPARCKRAARQNGLCSIADRAQSLLTRNSIVCLRRFGRTLIAKGTGTASMNRANGSRWVAAPAGSIARECAPMCAFASATYAE